MFRIYSVLCGVWHNWVSKKVNTTYSTYINPLQQRWCYLVSRHRRLQLNIVAGNLKSLVVLS